MNDVAAAALTRLARLDAPALAALHAGGSCPAPDVLVGTLDGAVLTGPLSATPWRQLRVWRGKAVEVRDGVVRGRNRLGVGPVEVRRFTFTVRQSVSAFSGEHVLLLDHDESGNPDWVRRFHDELVQIAPGVHLATSHHRTPGGLRPLAHFALVADAG